MAILKTFYIFNGHRCGLAKVNTWWRAGYLFSEATNNFPLVSSSWKKTNTNPKNRDVKEFNLSLDKELCAWGKSRKRRAPDFRLEGRWVGVPAVSQALPPLSRFPSPWCSIISTWKRVPGPCCTIIVDLLFYTILLFNAIPALKNCEHRFGKYLPLC